MVLNKTLYVQFKDGTGNVGATVNDAVTIDTAPPSPPASPTWPGAYAASTTAVLSWTDGSDAIAFDTHNVKACTNNNCTDGCLAPTTADTSPKTLSSLVNGSSYYGCVQARDQTGNLSAWTASASAVTIDMTAPGDPTGISVPSLSASDISITFTDGTEANPSHYNIKACMNSGCSTGCVGATTTASSPGQVAAASCNTLKGIPSRNGIGNMLSCGSR